MKSFVNLFVKSFVKTFVKLFEKSFVKSLIGSLFYLKKYKTLIARKSALEKTQLSDVLFTTTTTLQGKFVPINIKYDKY